MSLLSQFFPSGGGGAALGGGSIPVNVYMLAGGGASGYGQQPFNTIASGGGGHGMMVVADNYFIAPGTTYPITVGSGGSGCFPTCPGAGASGGNSCFSNPAGTLIAYGGGGGGRGGYAPSAGPGLPGGNGGGGISGGAGMAFGLLQPALSAFQTNGNCTSGATGGISLGSQEVQTTGWGFCAGFPGSVARCPSSGCPATSPAPGGSPQGPGGERLSVPTAGITYYYYTNSFYRPCYWMGCTCVPGSVGAGGPGGRNNQVNPGQAGIVVVQWPSATGAAPSYPGATDVSPSTPGFYTYCFTSSGSITTP